MEEIGTIELEASKLGDIKAKLLSSCQQILGKVDNCKPNRKIILAIKIYPY
jgi:hypothetical protein